MHKFCKFICSFKYYNKHSDWVLNFNEIDVLILYAKYIEKQIKRSIVALVNQNYGIHRQKLNKNKIKKCQKCSGYYPVFG